MGRNMQHLKHLLEGALGYTLRVKYHLLLLVTVFTQTLLTLVSSHLMTLSFLSAWHS